MADNGTRSVLEMGLNGGDQGKRGAPRGTSLSASSEERKEGGRPFSFCHCQPMNYIDGRERSPFSDTQIKDQGPI